jgi:hypothetical protein
LTAWVNAFYDSGMFEPMDPDLAHALIEQEPDVLSEAIKKETELYANIACPMCYQNGAEKRIPPPRFEISTDGLPMLRNSALLTSRPLPAGYAHCLHCGTDFDPHSGLIRQTEASIIADPDSDPRQP